jgi:hypothetical protein
MSASGKQLCVVVLSVSGVVAVVLMRRARGNGLEHHLAGTRTAEGVNGREEGNLTEGEGPLMMTAGSGTEGGRGRRMIAAMMRVGMAAGLMSGTGGRSAMGGMRWEGEGMGAGAEIPGRTGEGMVGEAGIRDPGRRLVGPAAAAGAAAEMVGEAAQAGPPEMCSGILPQCLRNLQQCLGHAQEM